VPFDIGPWEIVVLLAVLALLFGAKGVPDVARRLGAGVRELKDAVGEVDPRRMLEPGDDSPRKEPTSKTEGASKDPEA
jgi:TatA/E family protein of Tat protein translocase